MVDLGELPREFAGIVASVIETAEGFLRSGQEVEAVAFVGSSSERNVVPMAMDMGSDRAKDKSSESIRMAAQALGADFVLFVAESWASRVTDKGKAAELLAKYGSVSALPDKHKMEVVLFSLETRDGLWMAMPEIVPLGHSKKKRTMKAVSFVKADESRGRFVNLLFSPGSPEGGERVLH